MLERLLNPTASEGESPVACESLAPAEFPAVPWAWYYVGPLRKLQRRPVGITIGSRQFAVYRTAGGQIIALDGRCVHMNGNLAHGTVEGNCLRCPFHGWAFAADGRCVDIPAMGEIPPFARVRSYPTCNIGGHVFIFNRPEAHYPFPFFDGATPDELRAARPFVIETELPWYLVGANGFDGQHFRAAHDRELVREPTITQPTPWSYRIDATFTVVGNSWRDRCTRRISGREVRLTVTSYSGTLILVTAQFARTTTYGLVAVWPLGALRSRLVDIVWVRRRSGIGGAGITAIDAAVRRSFIRDFVQQDQQRSNGARFNRATFVRADAVLLGYLDWLQKTVSGEPSSSCATYADHPGNITTP